MMNQRQAVYLAVTTVLGDKFTGKITKAELSKEQLDKICAHVVDGLKSGRVELRNREQRSVEWINKYVPGLVDNWIRKDKALNGGVKYETKNPGSRAGSGDEQLTALKNLLKVTTDASARSKIQAAIDERLTEIKPKVSINVDALPDHLKHLAESILGE